MRGRRFRLGVRTRLLLTVAEKPTMATQGMTGRSNSSPWRHDEDGGELTERGEPAQPQYRIQTDMAARLAEIGGGNVGHFNSLAARLRSQIRAIRLFASPLLRLPL